MHDGDWCLRKQRPRTYSHIGDKSTRTDGLGRGHVPQQARIYLARQAATIALTVSELWFALTGV